ncbi:MAG: inositol oxygenase [Planctomycetota bacterium]|nr:MAG: inositol oxygenase [Planctomycetota bacterium]
MGESNGPLANLDEWDEDVLRRYQSPAEGRRFRDYERTAKPQVREFYRLNHRYQTVDFVRGKQRQYTRLDRATMGVWEAIELLNTLVDDSDPDIDLPQIEHLLQTAEAIRADGRPRWFILTGLIHDLGKILCLWGEPQWAVVGDTFPVGCAFSDKIVFAEFFAENPDAADPRYNSLHGMYQPHCGIEALTMSWGHDEYLYHVVRDFLPPPALAMIRYHSCYPIHHEGAYEHLLQPEDRDLLAWVRDFNRYDLYTKRDERMDVQALQPFYKDLIAEYFPDQLRW